VKHEGQLHAGEQIVYQVVHSWWVANWEAGGEKKGCMPPLFRAEVYGGARRKERLVRERNYEVKQGAMRGKMGESHRGAEKLLN